MLRLMDESPSMKLQLPLDQSQSQPASPSLRSTCPPCVSSTCPPTPLLGPFAHSSPLPAGPLDLSSHSGAVRRSASPLQQAQQAQLSQQQPLKPGQPQEDSRTCSSYASSLFSSSHYSSPQLTPVAMPQPSLLSTHQTSQHTPLGPAWQEHANGAARVVTPIRLLGTVAPVCVRERTPSLAPGAAEFLAAVIAQPTRLGLGIGLGSGLGVATPNL